MNGIPAKVTSTVWLITTLGPTDPHEGELLVPAKLVDAPRFRIPDGVFTNGPSSAWATTWGNR